MRKTTRKLTLRPESIRLLSNTQLADIGGGAASRPCEDTIVNCSLASCAVTCVSCKKD